MPAPQPVRPLHISVAGLTKRYGDLTVVNNVDLAVRPGECFGLLGPNGAGKTTTLRLLLGLAEPDAGEIALAGLPVPRRAREARRTVGIVPQTDNLDPDFSARENLLVYGRYFGIPGSEIAARIPALLEFAELTTRADIKIQKLSGGMKRRLTLARALINDPEILFLDEPTTGLDPQARHVIWERLKQLLARGKTILLTTHFMEEAERLCHRLAIMDHGKLIVTGTPRDLIAQHIEPQVVEVHGENLDGWAKQWGVTLSRRCEKIGETVFCYSRDPAALLSSLKGWPGLRYLHRPAHLEDVFLKLTGRELRE